jgi:hypothetical protein
MLLRRPEEDPCIFPISKRNSPTLLNNWQLVYYSSQSRVVKSSPACVFSPLITQCFYFSACLFSTLSSFHNPYSFVQPRVLCLYQKCNNMAKANIISKLIQSNLLPQKK